MFLADFCIKILRPSPATGPCMTIWWGVLRALAASFRMLVQILCTSLWLRDLNMIFAEIRVKNLVTSCKCPYKISYASMWKVPARVWLQSSWKVVALNCRRCAALVFACKQISGMTLANFRLKILWHPFGMDVYGDGPAAVAIGTKLICYCSVTIVACIG